MKRNINDIVDEVERMILDGEYREAVQAICDSMRDYPESAVPHNLMGILLEYQQEHARAMKQFRAAYALDPSYIPARYNMDQYGNFHARIHTAFRDEEVEIKKDGRFELVYDENKAGHLVRKW